jgi:hypothetical protein
MRFLTRNWLEGTKDQMAWLNLEVYARHLREIQSEMPSGARSFARMSSGLQLLEAAIVATTLDKDAGVFTLVLRVEGVNDPYFFELEYLGVDPELLELDDFDMAEYCLTEEFDLAPDEMFEHRILLAPEGEAVIRFKDMRLHAKRAGNNHPPPADDE